MKRYKKSCFLILLLLISAQLFSQEAGLLDSLPTTKEGFIKSEPAVMNTIKWLENTPLKQEPEKRKLLYANLLAWLTNTPTVTIEINTDVIPVLRKNPDLLFIFMAGWTKYSLQNGYSKDVVKGNIAGLKSLIKFYQTADGIKKDADVEKLVALDSKNELEGWVVSQLKKKE